MGIASALLMWAGEQGLARGRVNACWADSIELQMFAAVPDQRLPRSEPFPVNEPQYVTSAGIAVLPSRSNISPLHSRVHPSRPCRSTIITP